MTQYPTKIKPIQWQRLGQIYRPDTSLPWMHSHAQLPTPLHLYDTRYRIFFASRDDRQRSHVAWFEIDINQPDRIISTCTRPVLFPGAPGEFDGDGIYPSSFVREGNTVYLYFIGWNQGGRAPMFYASIGMAISQDGGETFVKQGRTPVMTRSNYDPCMVTAPGVIKEKNDWRMWYVSGYRWEETDETLRSYYHIKYASSLDGFTWNRDGRVCIDHACEEEKNIARCWVVPDADGYRAWYSYHRGVGYRIGYAESVDGLTWKRLDDRAGMEWPDEGFDSNSQCYATVVRHDEKWYMFYNGNQFGREGIGLAVGKLARD